MPMTHTPPAFTPCPFPTPPIAAEYLVIWEWYLTQVQAIHALSPYAGWSWWLGFKEGEPNRPYTFQGRIPGGRLTDLMFLYADPFHPRVLEVPTVILMLGNHFREGDARWTLDEQGNVQPLMFAAPTPREVLDQHIRQCNGFHKPPDYIKRLPINTTVPFSALALGAKFKYLPTERNGAAWVKIGHNEVAAWDERGAHNASPFQAVCCFTDKYPETPGALDAHIYPLDNPLA